MAILLERTNHGDILAVAREAIDESLVQGEHVRRMRRHRRGNIDRVVRGVASAPPIPPRQAAGFNRNRHIQRPDLQPRLGIQVPNALLNFRLVTGESGEMHSFDDGQRRGNGLDRPVFGFLEYIST